MRITLNLSPAASVRDRCAFAWAVPVSVAGLAALALLGRASLQEYREYRGYRQQASEVQARVDALRNKEASIRKKLQDPEGRALLHEVHFVNDLIDERQLSLSELSARVADLLPDDAHLTGLALTPPEKPAHDPMVRIGINAKGEDAVESFINDLEDAPDFKDVSIINQGFQEETALGEQVNIVCTARYLPGVLETAEDTEQEPEVKEQKSEAGKQKSGVGSQKSVAGSHGAKGSEAAKGVKPSEKAPAPKAGVPK